ncbi:MAG: Ig-like domain repeat protein, partial [Thermoflexales bacterium]|nr:Ig-like domain repeat protein [Thermoflexales bacterium]
DQMPDYPGTIPYVRHGSHVAYDPYAATMNSTLMLLPVQEWSSIPVFFPDLWPDLNRMNADYAVWVENDTTLHLLQWDDGSQQWTEIALPDTATFNFSTDTGTPLTEFYLPLDAVSATIGSQVNLVAFASDDDALRVWSVLPSTNPASSRKVMVNAVPAHEPFQFMLTDRYTFTLDDGDCRAPAYRTWLKVSPEPGGLAYTARDDEVRLLVPRFSAFSGAYSKVFQGYYTILDELVSRIDEPYQAWLTNTFCPANRYHPACGGTPLSLEEKLASYQDVDFSPLEPGERVTYTVHYINEQPIVKTFRSWFMPQPLDSIVWDEQPWVYGCPGWLDVTLPAKSEGDLTLTGEVVTFTQKVNLKFDPPETLAPNCSAGGIKPAEPYNNLTVYYSTDTQGPSYIAIDEPRSVIGQNTTTLRGTVIDASLVPTITLEFSVDGSPAQSTTCVNATPTSREWSCALDIGAQVGGSLVDVRAQATDQFGNVGDFSPWLTFMVDTRAPTTTLDASTQDALADSVIGPGEATLSGAATDDHLLSGVDVCTTDDVCTQAATTLDPATVPQTTYVYDDVPDNPIAIAANSGLASTAPSGVNVPNVCGPNTVGIWRTFSVTDDFVVSDVQLGLNISHPQRSDLRIKLWGWGAGAPAVDVIDFGSSVNAPNLDVLLTAATDQSVTIGREAQDVAQPYYDTMRLPSNALSAFKGRSAAGLWTLVICDTKPAADEGTYNRAQLILKAFTLPQATVGSWQYTFPFAESVDGALQTLSLYGYDSVGNREAMPQVVTFMADNVAPMLAVTQTETALGLFTPVQPSAFTGIVSDGTGVQSVMVTSYSPSGQVKIEAATFTDGGANLGMSGAVSSWSYALTPLEVGKYTVTVVATDRAGNSISAGTYEVNVLDIALGSYRTYLPLLASNTTISADQSESRRVIPASERKATEIAAPIMSAITNLFQWLTPSP